jgi:hypothetical protein
LVLPACKHYFGRPRAEWVEDGACPNWDHPSLAIPCAPAIAADVAARGYLNVNGRAFSAASVASMLGAMPHHTPTPLSDQKGSAVVAAGSMIMLGIMLYTPFYR